MVSGSFGVSFEGRETPEVMRTAVATAESAGATTIWIASHLFQKEPIAVAALALAASRRIGVALMSMSPYSVHPVYAAMAAATLDEYFPGRVQLCFGVGAPGDLEAAGIAAPQPLKTLRESIEISRALLAGESVNFQGERFHVQGRRLVTGARPVPIVLAASGPQMLELAGAIADGVLISAATAPAFIRWTLDHVRNGEARSNRTIRKIALVFSAVDNAGSVARNRVRRILAFVLRGAHHARNLELAGSALDQSALAEAYAREDWITVDRLMTDDVISRHAAAGTPEEVRAAFAAYRDVSLDEIVIAGAASSDGLRWILDTAHGK
ncbi:MAG TPA: LLM class flavin-dependent oxidoreductase [Candidatus Cybelea sp.]|nr:LLM class flavin-dependent oxidoreductase [Candidatus Cybelea sp.]